MYLKLLYLVDRVRVFSRKLSKIKTIVEALLNSLSNRFSTLCSVEKASNPDSNMGASRRIYLQTRRLKVTFKLVRHTLNFFSIEFTFLLIAKGRISVVRI